MPSPKDGSPCTVVPPTDADAATDADDAQPGEVEAIKAQQRQTGTGKYGSQPVDPFVPPDDPEDPAVLHWIEVVLIDDADQPVPGAVFKITMSDGKARVGTLDAKGFARVEGIPAGSCQITFPNLDQEAWEPA